MAEEGIIPKTAKGKFPASAVTAYLNWIRSNEPTIDSPPGSAGELIPAADVAATWTDAVVRMRARLLAIPTKLAPLVAV